jgi:hypothetical protein
MNESFEQIKEYFGTRGQKQNEMKLLFNPRSPIGRENISP